MKTAISLPDSTFNRIERAAAALGVSRSQFLARAAERWLDALEADRATQAINEAIEGVPHDAIFVEAAASALAPRHREW